MMVIDTSIKNKVALTSVEDISLCAQCVTNRHEWWRVTCGVMLNATLRACYDGA